MTTGADDLRRAATPCRAHPHTRVVPRRCRRCTHA